MNILGYCISRIYAISWEKKNIYSSGRAPIMDDSERMEISISDSEKEEISEPQSKSKE